MPIVTGIVPDTSTKQETPARSRAERDYEAEARGKVACVVFGDALKSPGLAGLTHTYADFMKRCPKKLVRGNAREGLLALGGFDGIDGEMKTLQTKLKILPERDKAAQLKYMGFVMPSKKIIARIKEARKRGLVAGIVMGAISKKSNYGEYTVYHTAPSGSFWSREYDFAVGDYVEVSVKKNSGRVLAVAAHE